MKKSAIVAAALLLGCNTLPPELLPPPFGPDGPKPPRLFFPTGLAAASNGVLIANGNFNRAFEAGTVVQISRGYIEPLLAGTIDCDVDPDTLDAATRNACYPQIPSAQFIGAAMIGNYAGPLALSSDQTAVFTASRDTATINAVRVRATAGPDGTLGCLPNAGNDATRDCRKGIIDLTAAGLDGPYTVIPGDTIPPGTGSPQDVFFVSSIVPHIDSITGGDIFTSTSVAALSMQDPSQLLFQMRAGSQFFGGGYGVGPMVFDRSRRRLYLGGCYKRSSAFGSGEPGTGLCIGVVNIYLRIIDVDAGSAADPLLVDLRTDVLSTFTVQLLLDAPATPATPASPITTLWATMRAPDSLVVIDLPVEPSVPPHVREVIPLPASPADMVRIDRGAAPPLLAIVGEKNNGVSILDTGTSQVVAQIGRLGDSPFNIASVGCPASKSNSACLAVSVFAECRIALIEVPKDDPAQSALRALAGSCPQ
jgi:YVTN family beta-propeller protein